MKNIINNIDEFQQRLQMDYNLTKSSIDNLGRFYHERMSHMWNASVSHYHIWIATSAKDDNLQIATSIYHFFASTIQKTPGFSISEKDLLNNPKQLLQKGRNSFVIIDDCKNDHIDEENIQKWENVITILNDYDCPACLLLLPADDFQNKFKDTPVYEPLFYQIFKYHFKSNSSPEDYQTALDYWLDNTLKKKRTEAFDREMKKYLCTVLAKEHTNKGRHFLEDLKKRFVNKYHENGDPDVIDECCIPHYRKETLADSEKFSSNIVTPAPSVLKKPLDSEEAAKKAEEARLRASATPFDLPEKYGDFFNFLPDSDPVDDPKNLLILTLSTISSPKVLNSRASYVMLSEDQNSEQEEYYYQLEPVPYKLMRDFKKSSPHEQLDGILMICSTDTFKESVTKIDPRYKCFSDTARNYFVYTTSKYAEKNNVGPLSYKEIHASVGNGESDPVQRAKNTLQFVHDVIKEIRVLKKHYPRMKIYVDTHGGFRTDQEVLNSILSLLQMENIIIPPENIYSVELNTGTNRAFFTSATEIFNIMDFVSGIHECINYGQIKSLHNFQNDADDENKVLNAIQTIAEGIQLCDVAKFEDGLTTLSLALPKLKNQDTLSMDAGYLTLFQNLIHDSYGEQLLNSNRRVIDEIKWCIKKEFIQQALTLVESKMPLDILHEGLLISKITTVRRGNENVHTLSIFASRANNRVLSNDFITYISAEDSPKQSWVAPENYIVQRAGNAAKRSAEKKASGDKRPDAPMYPLISIYNSNKHGFPTRNYHVAANPKARSQIEELLCKHMDLKQERNTANHAGSDENRASLADIRQKLKDYVQRYEEIIAILNSQR